MIIAKRLAHQVDGVSATPWRVLDRTHAGVDALSGEQRVDRGVRIDAWLRSSAAVLGKGPAHRVGMRIAIGAWQ